MAAKVPAVVRIAKQALIENKCVVIGIQSTGEARTEEAVAKYVSLFSLHCGYWVLSSFDNNNVLHFVKIIFCFYFCCSSVLADLS